jgi:hypothetical protein
MIPYNVEMPGETAWLLCLDLVSYVVPVVQISALTIALTIRDDSSSNIQSHAPILRFTIRDLLWLTVVVGLGVGWWCNMAAYQRRVSRGETDHTLELMVLEKHFADEIEVLRTENEKLRATLPRASADEN